MNTLRLEIINLHAPYRVKQREDKPQDYYFRTDYGVEYDISLEEDFSIVPSGVYALDITNREYKRSPLDPKFRMTLIAIVEEFFERNNDVMLYVTETGDKNNHFVTVCLYDGLIRMSIMTSIIFRLQRERWKAR
jgi:hypothetical protein